jgi:hypothetical protein
MARELIRIAAAGKKPSQKKQNNSFICGSCAWVQHSGYACCRQQDKRQKKEKITVIRMLYATFAMSLLVSSVALAQAAQPADRSSIDRELSNPESSAQNSADRGLPELDLNSRDLPNQTSASDNRNGLAAVGEEGNSPKADSINPGVTVQNIPPLPPVSKPPVSKAKIMGGERELTTGILSKDASFRLIVSGPVGVKEIERLIAKLELDKEILATSDSAAE